jgi:hypothetical protein
LPISAKNAARLMPRRTNCDAGIEEAPPLEQRDPLPCILSEGAAESRKNSFANSRRNSENSEESKPRLAPGLTESCTAELAPIMQPGTADLARTP